MYFARKHIASHRKTCHTYRYFRQCVYCDDIHPREEDHDCEEGRAARREKRMQMMREKREREKKEQKALEKIAVPLKKNSDFMVDEYDVEGSMQVEESDGTFVDCRLYRHKSKKRNVVLYFSNGLFEGINLNYTLENGVLKDDDGQLISYKKFISANGRAANKKSVDWLVHLDSMRKALEKHGDNFNAIHNDKSLRLPNVPLYNMKRAFKRHDAKIRAKMKTKGRKTMNSSLSGSYNKTAYDGFVKAAIESIRAGENSVADAAKNFSLPENLLRQRIEEMGGIDILEMAKNIPESFLNAAVESVLTGT